MRRALRTWSCVIALVAMASVTAQAADSILTLACQGTVSAVTADKPEPISIGIIVNFTKQTVHGFGDPIFGEQLIKLTGVTETVVSFGGDDKSGRSAMGTIDRVTGDVEASTWLTDSKTGKTITSTSYALKCRPAQRMF